MTFENRIRKLETTQSLPNGAIRLVYSDDEQPDRLFDEAFNDITDKIEGLEQAGHHIIVVDVSSAGI